MSKFKVGDKVTGTKNYQRMYGIEDTISEIKNGSCSTRYRLKNFGNSWWLDDELKLVEAKAEFTFEEVIARIKEGEVYETTSNLFRAKKIMRNGWISIEFVGNSNKIGFPGKYRLVPQKKEYQLYEVEHQEGGKRYLFRSMLGLKIGKIVVCDTRFGKTYGRIVDSVTKELTEEEYKAYKLIIKSV